MSQAEAEEKPALRPLGSRRAASAMRGSSLPLSKPLACSPSLRGPGGLMQPFPLPGEEAPRGGLPV